MIKGQSSLVQTLVVITAKVRIAAILFLKRGVGNLIRKGNMRKSDNRARRREGLKVTWYTDKRGLFGILIITYLPSGKT